MSIATDIDIAADAPEGETTKERRNRQARERRAAKRLAKQSDETAVEADGNHETATLDDDTPTAETTVDQSVQVADNVTVYTSVEAALGDIELPTSDGDVIEVEEVPVDTPVEGQNDDDADDTISEVLGVTQAEIEAAKAGIVKGEKCPGYGMVVTDEVGHKGNGTHERVECPVCEKSVKRYAKSGKLGSHRA